jgi:hypothetical protein
MLPWLYAGGDQRGPGSTAFDDEWVPNPFIAAGVIVAIVLVGAVVILFAAASPSIDVAVEGFDFGSAVGLLVLVAGAFASVFAIVRASLLRSESLDALLDPIAHAVRQTALGVWALLSLACVLIAVGTPGGVGVGVPLALFLVFLPGSVVLWGLYLIAGWLGREQPEGPKVPWFRATDQEAEQSGSWPSGRWWTTLPGPSKPHDDGAGEVAAAGQPEGRGAAPRGTY